MNGDGFKRIVFCDFDGTITVEETFVAMLGKFAPEKMREFTVKFAENKTTLREGVRKVVESIPSREYARMVEFIRDREIRRGFLEFLKFLRERNTPFVVISGGLLDSVRTRLAPFGDCIHAVYAAEVETDGEFLRVISPFEEGDALVSKVRVMSRYEYDESAVIGDGATDHEMAMNSSIVFARDRLAEFMAKKEKRFVPWNDFFDIKNYLAQNWKI
jgi:2-hydroxy-3-keto-5-methylthiopentenyl-1-phosphate phosphatase